MDINTGRVIEEKRVFIARLQTLLHADPRSEVKQLTYKVAMCGENIAAEYVEIEFFGGYMKRICTTHNSNGANLLAVALAVYRG